MKLGKGIINDGFGINKVLKKKLWFVLGVTEKGLSFDGFNFWGVLKKIYD